MTNTLGMSLASGTQREAVTNGLVREGGNGDSAALIRLYEATGPEILGFIMSLISSREVAEEVLLDTYTDAWRQCPIVDAGRIDVSEWLRVLARARAVKKLHSSEAETNPSGEDADASAESPSEYLKDLLLMRIEREPQNPTHDQFQSAIAAHHPPFGTARDPESTRAWLPWVLAAALAVAAGLLFYNWRTTDQGKNLASKDAITVSKERDQLANDLAAARARNKELDQIDEILKSTGARTLSVESLPAAPHISLAVLWDVQGKRCVIVGIVPRPQEGKQYQLWLTTPGVRTSIATLQPDAAGRVFMVAPFAPPSTRQASLQITLEPLGGSQQPSTDTYASGKIG